jgi:PAS domain S-box-containing protein
MSDAAQASPAIDELAALRAERDHYRAIAERTERKSVADAAAMSALIAELRATQAALREAGQELERQVEERTAEVRRANDELRAEVAERTKAERAARESEELYRLLTLTSPEAITVTDPAGFALVANERALALYGCADPSEAIGQNLLDWVAPEARARAGTALVELLQRDAMRDVEVEVRRRDGTGFTASLNGAVVRTPEGVPRFIIVVSSDVTTRKQAEAEFLRTQKLESLGVLAGGIAHDFNNLLTGVLGNLSLGAELAGEHVELRRCLADAERASLRARELTTQLLTFSRGGQPVKRPISLATVLEESTRFGVRGSAVRCDLHVSSELRTVSADPGQLAQVVDNLVINAVQAMPTGGAILVRADNVDLAADEVAGLPPGPYVRVDVADSGPGIPEALWSRIFDPYFTTKKTGSGLGLAVAYSIVRNHGGALQLEPRRGEGATFVIHLPAVGGSAEPTRARPEASPLRPAKVLVMDDERLVRNVALRCLRQLGFQGVATCDGEEAIAAFAAARASGAPFDLVILDLTVPGGLGGIEALPRLRALDPNVRVIVSSGYSVDAVTAEHRKHGFDGVLPKPYRLEELRAALHATLDAEPRTAGSATF